MRVLSFLEVADAGLVGIDRVNADVDAFVVTLVEFGFHFGNGSEFGGADWGVIFRMGKENSPAIAKPLMEIDAAFAGVRGEIGRCIS